MFSFLGKLPASTSVSGAIDSLDIQKTLRLAVVVFVGAFCASVSAAGDLSTLDFAQVLTDAANAGVMALGSATVELVRRLLVNQAV